MKIPYFAKVVEENGVPTLKITNRKAFLEHLRTFIGCEIVITIEKKKRKRSELQNAYYHGVILPCVRMGLKDMGFQEYRTNEQVHDLLKYRFLKTDSANEHGQFIERIKSTTELSTSEFMDFIAEIQQFSAEFLNISIPEPNKDWKLNL